MKPLSEITSFQSQTNKDEGSSSLNLFSTGKIDYVVKNGTSERGDEWSLLGVTLPDGSKDIVLLGHEKFEELDISECIGKTLHFFHTARGKKAASIEESFLSESKADNDKSSFNIKNVDTQLNANKELGIYKLELRKDALEKLQDIVAKIPSLHMSLLKLMSINDE